MGFFARERIKRGACILVDHPVAFVLDIDHAARDYSALDGSDTLALFEVVVKQFDSKIEECLRALYPARDSLTVIDSLDIDVPAHLVELARLTLPADLPLNKIIRTIQLNSMGFYTLPELTSYQEHMRFLSGTALYPNGSFFNHSCAPNVDHSSFGVVTVFRANRDLEADEELFITYIGADLLCESKSVRDEFLAGRDFTCCCSNCIIPETEDPWVEELDLNTRISIRLSRSVESRCALIRSLLNTRHFIKRDRIDLQFMIARELGGEAESEWEVLLSHAEEITDFLSVVIYVHYLVLVRWDSCIWDLALQKAGVTLGPELASPNFLVEIFAVTDFGPSSPWREMFLERFSIFRVS